MTDIAGYEYALWPKTIFHSTLIFALATVLTLVFAWIIDILSTIQVIIKLLSIIYLFWMAYLCSMLFFNWSIVRRASITASKHVGNFYN